jgi:hypothetical protein
MSIELIIKKLDKLELKIQSIEEKIDNLNYKLDNNIINNCEKMGSHVDFVENVYEKVRYPLQYLSNKLSVNKNQLPVISSQKNLQENK